MLPNGSITVSSRRVLVIENSASDRQLLRHWLMPERVDTYEASDIISGLGAALTYHPNLILLQLRLPTWDGFQVIKRLKDDPRTRSTPVIFIAASATTAEKARGIDMGAVDFVSKPFDPVELIARVNSALRTKALLDLLEQRAHLDGLTELGNRFALNEKLPTAMASARESGAPLAVVIADLDHFKRVNDRHGHAAGDEVLRRTALLLREAVGEGPFLARYGGEEFVVVLPGLGPAAALDCAERVRQRIAEVPVRFREHEIQLTASLGVAVAVGGSPADPAELLERADRALYRAKSAGRNTIWYYDPDSNAPAPAAVFRAAAPPPTAEPEPEPVPVPGDELTPEALSVAGDDAPVSPHED